MFVRKEWEKLRSVIIHRPGIEIDYAMLAPRAFLFERPFNKQRAISEHVELEQKLRENGVKVTLLREMFNSRAKSDTQFRDAMEKKVMERVVFYGDIDDSKRLMEEFSKNIGYLDADTLFNLMILEPAIDVRMDESNNMQYPKIFSNIPLANLYFMRDQQATGANGIVSGRMRLPQRRSEPSITGFIMENVIGKNHVKKIGEESFFEGGDYIPCGDFGLIGTGPRTDLNGAMDALNSGMFSHDEVLILENPKYDFMVDDLLNNMHLDTYFNIPSGEVAICSARLAKKAKGQVYEKNGEGYTPGRKINLYDYMVEKGFNILDLSIVEQLSYSSNFLTISDGKILCVDSSKVFRRLLKNNILNEDIARKSSFELPDPEDEMFPIPKKMAEFGIDYITIDLEELTGGYGGAHCMTMAMERS
ncbi:arginine deiminase family protein [Cuniculiplasma sp. SKW3]|uniref:arginine deiminase family protein n=1 Tax=Cuniculiplasma sp. SKW3 TaxID=3400170 RepID=UPI003FD3ECDF